MVKFAVSGCPTFFVLIVSTTQFEFEYEVSLNKGQLMKLRHHVNMRKLHSNQFVRFFKMNQTANAKIQLDNGFIITTKDFTVTEDIVSTFMLQNSESSLE